MTAFEVTECIDLLYYFIVYHCFTFNCSHPQTAIVVYFSVEIVIQYFHFNVLILWTVICNFAAYNKIW
jgi:hypothetical protein